MTTAATVNNAVTYVGEVLSAARTWVDARLAEMNSVEVGINSALTVVVVVVVLLAGRFLSRAARHKPHEHEGAPAPRHNGLGFALGLARLALWIMAGAIVLQIWGVDISASGTLLSSGWAPVALRILVVLALAAAAWDGASVAINAAFNTAAKRADGARRASQLRSLAPLLRGVARVVIVVLGGLVIISQMGVEIGPLLAGAGVVGIAVGLGAQTLVKDYLTGFSLILEDIVSVGDVARIGDSSGVVEAMTLRTIRLRDFDGTLHVIPYGETQVVHNLTKTFSYYVFNLSISYESDIDKALEIIREVGDGLQQDVAFRDKILAPIEVFGVDMLADSGVVLKARIKTAPSQQWTVGREYNKRIKLAFDEAGIEIPVPHIKLLLSDRALEAVKPS